MGEVDLIHAGFRKRILAFLIDYVIMAVYIIVLTVVFLILRFGPLQIVQKTLFATPLRGQVSVFIMLTLPVILYFALLESSSRQQTFGKGKIGLKVVSINGSRLSCGKSLIRSSVKFIPWELAHTCLWRIEGWPLNPQDPSPIVLAGLILVWVLVGIYFISMFLSKKNRTLYDLIAGTYVILF